MQSKIPKLRTTASLLMFSFAFFPLATLANFTQQAVPGLPPILQGTVAWADYNNDGLLDFFLSGFTNADYTGRTSQIWQNNGSGFTNVTSVVAPGLAQISRSTMGWGDVNNDGLLDFFLTGYSFVSEIWQHSDSGFSNVTAVLAPTLPAFEEGSGAWADYDQDGRIDLLLTGGPLAKSQIWRNTGSGFSNVTAQVAPGLPAVTRSSVAWGDYDGDGRVDFLLTGSGNSQLWRNTTTGFSNVTATATPGLPQVETGCVAWGDYDADGLLDFLISGRTGGANDDVVCQIWHNTSSGFSNVTASLAPDMSRYENSSCAWGDFDNDGLLDFIIAGKTNRIYLWGNATHLWRNTGNGFSNVTDSVVAGLLGVEDSCLAWGDYDNDGRLDFLVGGRNYLAGNIAQLWHNETAIANTPPTAPTGLAMTLSSEGVLLSWNAATDAETPSAGLSYNVRAGTTPGGSDLISPHAASNGFRRLPALGNAQMRLNMPLTGLTNGQTVYWSVQAVDNAFAGGPFAPEQSFTFGQTFTRVVVPGLPGGQRGSVTWADFDNDGLLDFLRTGLITNSLVASSELWKNTGDGFTNATESVAPGLPGIWWASTAWGDYDNDGFLDFLLMGRDESLGTDIATIWHNNATSFSNLTANLVQGLPGREHSSLAWSDFDNDGLLDFLHTGGDFIKAMIWRNTGAGFTNVTAIIAPGFSGGPNSSGAWGDYDNDGWVDILISGGEPSLNHTEIWKNTAEGFTNVTAQVAPGISGFVRAAMAWGDINNDGLLDFCVGGLHGGSEWYAEIWQNTGSGFSSVTATIAPELTNAFLESLAWGDFDNDGRLDLLCLADGALELFQNTEAGFANVTQQVFGNGQRFAYGWVAWGDYDNDGRLDFLVCGLNLDTNNKETQLWKNQTAIANTPPTAPTGLAMTVSSEVALLSWNAATDAETPSTGLSYNVRAGTTPGGSDLISPHAASNGFRRLPALGNAQMRLNMPLTGLTNGQTVYWSVQAVDTAFAGGPFAAETSVVSIPKLSITSDSGTDAVVSWSPPTLGWVLQQSSTIAPPDWTDSPSGAQNPAIVPTTNGQTYYRLFSP